jgi:YVTN family beta-propeller protein/VCBS repeat-containing protein
MMRFVRKIASLTMGLPFASAVLTTCLLETTVSSAPASITADSLKLVKTVKVGAEPTGMAITPDGNYLYVANYRSNTVSVIDTAKNNVSATITLSPGSGAFISSVAITPDGSTVFVLDADSTIAVISTSTNTVLETISAGPSFGTGLAVTQDGTELYVSNFSGTVTIIDVASGSIVNTLNVGAQTGNVAISPDGTYAYVIANSDGGPLYLTQIEVASQTIVTAQLGVGEIKSASGGMAFSSDSQTVYLPEGEDDVIALNATTGQLENTFVISSEKRFYLGGIQVSADGQSLYVAETTGKAVATVNITTGKVVATSVGARHPNSVVISPSGTYLYVASYSSPTTAKGAVSVFSE